MLSPRVTDWVAAGSQRDGGFVPRYRVNFSQPDEPFGLSVQGGGMMAFDSTGLPFIFKDQYIEFASRCAHPAMLAEGQYLCSHLA